MNIEDKHKAIVKLLSDKGLPQFNKQHWKTLLRLREAPVNFAMHGKGDGRRDLSMMTHLVQDTICIKDLRKDRYGFVQVCFDMNLGGEQTRKSAAARMTSSFYRFVCNIVSSAREPKQRKSECATHIREEMKQIIEKGKSKQKKRFIVCNRKEVNRLLLRTGNEKMILFRNSCLSVHNTMKRPTQLNIVGSTFTPLSTSVHFLFVEDT